MQSRDFLLSTGVTYAGTVVSVLLTAAFYVVSLRIGNEAYGELQSTLSFMFLLYAGRGAAAGYIVMHAAGNAAPLGPIVRHAARLALLVGAIITGTIFTLAPLLRDFLRLETTHAFLLIGVAALPCMFGGMFEGILNVQRRFGALAISTLLPPASNLALAFILLHDGFHEAEAGWIILGSQFLSCVNGLLVRWDFLHDRSAFAPSRSSLREVVELLLASLMFGAALRFDVFWAKHILSPADAGTYAISASIAAVLYMITGSISRVTTVSLRSDQSSGVIAASYAATFALASALAGGYALFGSTALRMLAGRTIDVDWAVLGPLFIALTCFTIITLDYSCLNVLRKRVHAEMGIALIVALSAGIPFFGHDARSTALSFCAIMMFFSAAYSLMLLKARASGRDSATQPETPHLAHSLTQ